MVPLDGGKSQRSRGGGGRAPRAQSMGGALGPAHALVLRVWGALGPPRPAKRRRPPAHPNGDLLPPRQHASVGPTAVARRRPGRPRRSNGGRRRLAAVGRPAGPPHCPKQKSGPGAKGPGPRSFRALRAPPPQFAKVVVRRRQGGFLQLPCSLGFRLAFSATGGARLPQFAKVVARRRQSGFLQLPCSLGFRLAFSATGGARFPLPPGFPPTPKRPKETSPTNQARRSR